MTTTNFIQLNQNIRSLRPSATLAINERSSELIRQGKKVYRLGFGQSPFPVPEEVVESLKNAAHIKDYLPVKGLLELRRAVADFNRRTLDIESDAEQVLVGPGSKELIFNLQMAFDGDLMLPSPSWVSYEPQAQLANKKVIWVDTEESQDWKLTPEKLDAACLLNPNRAKILILNYPNNPVGNSYSESELKALSEVFRRREILVIADEIYGEVHHSGAHFSLVKYYPEGTIISAGLSKWCGAGGWRLGTFTIPKNYNWLLNAMATIASETFTSVSAPIQYAAVTAFEGSPEIDDYLNKSRKILGVVGNYVYEKLSELNITSPKPEGGFYLFPNFENHRSFLAKKGVKNSTDLCETLLNETGIALLPGVAFGRPETELTARLSFVDFDGEKLLEVADSASGNSVWTEKYCPNISDAMKALKGWLA